MNISSKYFSLSWIPILLLVLTGGSLVFVFFRKEVLYLTLFFFAGLFIYKSFFKNEIIKLVQLLTIFLSLLIFNYLNAPSQQSTQKLFANFVIFGSSIFSALFYSRQENKKLFVRHLFLVLKIIMFHALINFLIYPLVNSQLVEISNNRYSCYTFYNLFFYLKNTHGFSDLGVELVRNQGVFWEPGVLQIFLNLLLFIILFVEKKKGVIYWLTILTILTTVSSTGYLIMFVQLILSIRSDFKKNILFFPVSVFMLVLVYFVTSANLSDKIGERSNSFQARYFDLIQPLQMVYEYPLSGVGLDDEQFMYLRQKSIYSINLEVLDFSNLEEKGYTNSIIFFLAATGIPFTILVLFCLYSQDLVFENKIWFFIFMIICLMSNPVLLRPFFLTFVMSGGIKLLDKFRWQTF